MGHYDDFEMQATKWKSDLTDDELGFTYAKPAKPSRSLNGVCAPSTSLPESLYGLNKTKFNTGAEKDVNGKPRFDLIPPEAMLALAEVYSLGAGKYEDRNWEKGIPFSVCLAALKRHLNQFELGNRVNTSDGNLSHLDHVMWWAVALVTFLRRSCDNLNDLPAYNTGE